MFKHFSILLLIVLSYQGETFGHVIFNENLNKPVFVDPKVSPVWKDHIMDFLELIDVEQVMNVALGYLGDPEVLNFITFVLSDDFKNLIWQFESIEEFKEAFRFLSYKGYDIESVINFINNALSLPPFEKIIIKEDQIARGNGMKGLIEDIIATLPMDDIKKLFESKLETSPELRELFETINSPEFMDILKRLSKDPKFAEFKEVFEGFGFDFKWLCNLAKELFGEYYQGVFCEQ